MHVCLHSAVVIIIIISTWNIIPSIKRSSWYKVVTGINHALGAHADLSLIYPSPPLQLPSQPASQSVIEKKVLQAAIYLVQLFNWENVRFVSLYLTNGSMLGIPHSQSDRQTLTLDGHLHPPPPPPFTALAGLLSVTQSDQEISYQFFNISSLSPPPRAWKSPCEHWIGSLSAINTS